eukprot:1310757-Pyramimonas_sp.AAC.1
MRVRTAGQIAAELPAEALAKVTARHDRERHVATRHHHRNFGVGYIRVVRDNPRFGCIQAEALLPQFRGH